MLLELAERFDKQREIYGLHAARVLAIHSLRQQGYSYREIGRALNLSHERVRQLNRETVNLGVDT